jgi:hypothetical protein
MMENERLHRMRTSQAQRKSAPQAKMKSGVKFRQIIMTSALGILVTAVFGDLFVKKYVKDYLEEQQAFQSSFETGQKLFKDILEKYNNEVKHRRRETQQIAKYIPRDKYDFNGERHEHDVIQLDEFVEFYPQYYEAVILWNKNLSDMANNIVKATGCKSMTDKARKRRIIDKVLRDAKHVFKDKIASFGGEGIFESIRSDLLNTEQFCPTYFLTRTSEKFIYSVHLKMASMHHRIYEYRIHDFNKCRIRHRSIHTAHYRTCLELPLIDDRQMCMSEVDEVMRADGFCTSLGFSIDKYLVKPAEFDQLDLFWYLGKQMTKSFERDFLLRHCEGRRVFGHFFKPALTVSFNQSPF